MMKKLGVDNVAGLTQLALAGLNERCHHSGAAKTRRKATEPGRIERSS
jgi:hypothetical protein